MAFKYKLFTKKKDEATMIKRIDDKEYDYKSYKWFGENYSRFLYIDRIVIAKDYRRQGLGNQLYQYAFEHAKMDGIGMIAAAINAENKDSLEFHTRMGFSEVGNQLIRGGTIRISQQMKEPSDVYGLF